MSPDRSHSPHQKSEAVMDDKTLTGRGHIACSHADTGQWTDALARASHIGCPDQRRVPELISEGVQTVGVETMEGIKKRI